ncbi:RsuA 16S rRNA uridine-516 pseudouridylate synthase and related pseudouridylate synthases [Burkholderiaceae bacterium]
MSEENKPRTLSLKPVPKRRVDPLAPRRAPVRPSGPARAKSVSESAPKAPRAPAPRQDAPREWARREPEPRYAEPRYPEPRGHEPRDAVRTPAPGSSNAQAPGMVRLNKRMADLGLCSRREADEWIARGWVVVNGEPAQMGWPVPHDARVEVLPQAQHQQNARVTIVLNKPMGYVSGQPEDGHESAAVLVQGERRWREDPNRSRHYAPEHSRGLAPAGRLDIDSIGLLVLTQDGRVARTLIGEDSDVEKEYLVRVQWAPNGPQGEGVVGENVQAVFPRDRLALLRHGLSLDDQALKPAQVDWQNPEQLRFVLTEGKKRQIRRMCEQVGLHVVGLKRIRIGRVVLGNLPVGQWRYLAANERF